MCNKSPDCFLRTPQGRNQLNDAKTQVTSHDRDRAEPAAIRRASYPRHTGAGDSGGASAPFQAPKDNAKQSVRESDGLSADFISEFNAKSTPITKASARRCVIWED